MFNNDYTRNLLQIEGLVLNDIQCNEGNYSIHFELERKVHNCPNCHQQTQTVHDYRTQTIKDISILGKHTLLLYKKRRYVCKHCQKRFYEKNDFVPKYYRMTHRLVRFIINEMRSVQDMTSIAHRCNVSAATVSRTFKHIHYSMRKLPRVLSIDEFKGNTGFKKYQCILTDPENKKVLDILHGREQHILSNYFKDFKDRDKVEFFVMDMWRPYLDIAKTFFKNATIVIDKYHFIRQIIWAFERVRKSVQKDFLKVRRTTFKRSRFLLLKRKSQLSEYEANRVEVMLLASRRIRHAYLIKEKFFEFIDATSYEHAKAKLNEWYMYLMTSDEKEFVAAEKTIRTWQPYILNAFKCNFTNGYTEGCNNKIKVLKRNAYGYRDFDRFRSRILHMMA